LCPREAGKEQCGCRDGRNGPESHLNQSTFSAVDASRR
jgi:hypothetical protein